MKYFFSFLIALKLILTTAAAIAQPENAFNSSTGSSKVIEVPSLSDGYPKPCRIKLIPPSGGYTGAGGFGAVLPHVRSKYNDLSVGFICLTTTTDEWRAGRAAKFDDQTGIWEKDLFNRMGSDGDPELFAILNKAVRVLQLSSKNSSGFVTTEDDSMGPDWRKERTMVFCLLHDAQALCGGGPVMRLQEPRSNMLPDALKVLRSIEFVD